MLEDTDTLRVPFLPVVKKAPAEREPRNNLLALGAGLVAAAVTAICIWIGDPKMSHAQIALITAVVMVVGAAAVLSCHYMRVWVRQVKKDVVEQMTIEAAQIIKTLDTNSRTARAQRLDVSNDVSTVSAELEGLKALWVDFIKSYPPLDTDDRLYRLAERVEALTCAVEGLPQALEPEWAKALRRDLDALGTPDVADMEPLLNLRSIAQRLRDNER